MILSLDDDQAALMREILDSTFRNLKAEIAHTDNSRFKEQLRTRERGIVEILDALGGPLPDAP